MFVQLLVIIIQVFDLESYLMKSYPKVTYWHSQHFAHFGLTPSATSGLAPCFRRISTTSWRPFLTAKCSAVLRPYVREDIQIQCNLFILIIYSYQHCSSAKLWPTLGRTYVHCDTCTTRNPSKYIERCEEGSTQSHKSVHRRDGLYYKDKNIYFILWLDLWSRGLTFVNKLTLAPPSIRISTTSLRPQELATVRAVPPHYNRSGKYL